MNILHRHNLPFYISVIYVSLAAIFFAGIAYMSSVVINRYINVNENAYSDRVRTGQEPVIVGVVTKNVIDLEGLSYLIVETDIGEKVRVTYSRGEEGCVNYTATKSGFDIVDGNRVEAYGKAISREEMVTCDLNKYYIDFLTKGGLVPDDLDYKLDFFAGGSFFSKTFIISINDKKITYEERGGSSKERQEDINRPLTSSEFKSIRRVISEANLVYLESQDFKNIPLLPDQPYYEISLEFGKYKNKIKCSIPNPITAAGLECQRRIDVLRKELNKVLNVNIE
jgi:hypothetical protein